jgi:hypothetical protein
MENRGDEVTPYDTDPIDLGAIDESSILKGFPARLRHRRSCWVITFERGNAR